MFLLVHHKLLENYMMENRSVLFWYIHVLSILRTRYQAETDDDILNTIMPRKLMRFKIRLIYTYILCKYIEGFADVVQVRFEQLYDIATRVP